MALSSWRWLHVVGVTVSALLMADPARAISISWVTVGNPGNPADTNFTGAVAAEYRIMAFEFTNSQYAAFLNAVDPAGVNPNSIYNPAMGTGRGGILNSGSQTGARYVVAPNMGDKPVNYVSWFDAARVANWLHNGQGNGDTETGAYTLANSVAAPALAVNVGARFWIPTEDQWYKAAYFNAAANGGAGGYSAYPHGFAHAAPVDATAEGVGRIGEVTPVQSAPYANFQAQATWNGLWGNVTSVGTNGAPSFYGAYDMAGNVAEWSEPVSQNGIDRSTLPVRGGTWLNTLPTDLSSSARFTKAVAIEDDELGFRLVSPVPEPAALGLASGGLVAAVLWRVSRIRRRQAKPLLHARRTALRAEPLYGL